MTSQRISLCVGYCGNRTAHQLGVETWSCSLEEISCEGQEPFPVERLQKFPKKEAGV